MCTLTEYRIMCRTVESHFCEFVSLTTLLSFSEIDYVCIIDNVNDLYKEFYFYKCILKDFVFLLKCVGNLKIFFLNILEFHKQL